MSEEIETSVRLDQEIDENAQAQAQSLLAKAIKDATRQVTSKDNDTSSSNHLAWLAAKHYQLIEDKKVPIAATSFNWGNPQRGTETLMDFQPKTLDHFNNGCERFNNDVPSSLGTDKVSPSDQTAVMTKHLAKSPT